MQTRTTFETLVEYHSAEIFAYLWRLVYDTAEAEDCLQDTFLRALRAFPRLRDGSNPRAWLYKIATNVAYTHLKKLRREDNRRVDYDSKILPPEPSAALRAEHSERLEAVLHAIQALPHHQRAALLLRKYHGASYAEISDALQCSQTAARAHVYQGLKKLLDQFPEYADERKRS